MRNLESKGKADTAPRSSVDFSCSCAQNASWQRPRNLSFQRAEGTLPRLEQKGD
jgi:hypothetical protein